MARILYAINGDGMGHVIRSVALIEELKKIHRIEILVGSMRGLRVLKKHFKNVRHIDGLSIAYADGAVDDIETAKSTLKKFFNKGAKNFSKVAKIINDFRPDVIISDFEHGTVQIATFFNIPVICVCNIHSITHLKYKLPKKHARLQNKTKMIMHFLTPVIKYHIITSFFKLPKSGKNVWLVPPVMRERIRKLKPLIKDYVMVYQTSPSDKELLRVLKSTNYKYIVYGYNIAGRDKNLTFRKFNEDVFFSDFKDCKAVITNGGFTLITEAIALRKPIISMPVRNQFEQLLNATYVHKLGYGEMHERLHPSIIKNFIAKLDIYRRNMARKPVMDNSETLGRINDIIKKEMG